MPYFAKIEYKLHLKNYALAEASLYSGEVKLKEAENGRLRLSIEEKDKTIETQGKLLKAEETRANKNEEDMNYYKDLSEKGKKRTRFWRVSTIVVGAVGLTYVGIDQFK